MSQGMSSTNFDNSPRGPRPQPGESKSVEDILGIQIKSSHMIQIINSRLATKKSPSGSS